MQKIPVLVIFAPTASGKTELVGKLFSDNANSVLAGKAEIINSDSMQVYRGMNVGTAKPDTDFLKHLPHHLIDICSPDEQFGVGEFLPLADKICTDIYNRGKLPVICGGTAFYIRNFIYGLPITPKADLVLRENLKKRMKAEGAAVLKAELDKLDPEAGKRIHVNDEYRIQRALEVCYSTGKALSDFSVPEIPRDKYNFLIIQLVRPRDELYERINLRVEQMFEQGLTEEFFALRKAGFTKDTPGMQAIGYREFFMIAHTYFGENNVTESTLQSVIDWNALEKNSDYLSKVKELIQRDSRHYAKRQLTFFAPMNGVCKFAQGDFNIIEKIIFDFFVNDCKYPKN